MTSIKITPVITEKSNQESQKLQFTFKVPSSLNKIEIAKAMKELTGVEVTGVRVINVDKKQRLLGRSKVMTKRQSHKKAIVSFKEAIDLNKLSETKVEAAK